MTFLRKHFLAIVIGVTLLILLWNWWRKINATPKTAFVDIISAKSATKTVRFRMNINGDPGPDREIRLGDNDCVSGRNNTKSCWRTTGNKLVISLVDKNDDKKVYDQIIADFDKKIESKYTEDTYSKGKPLMHPINPAALNFDRVKEKMNLENLFTLTSQLNKTRKDCSADNVERSAAILNDVSVIRASIQHPGIRNVINDFIINYGRMLANCSNKAVGRKLGMLKTLNGHLDKYDKTF